MRATAKPLQGRTAADLMSQDVVSLPCEMSLRTAARCLARARVSGAPVVDASGRCVGVLTATDFLYWAGRVGDVGRRGSLPLCACTDWALPDTEHLPED